MDTICSVLFLECDGKLFPVRVSEVYDPLWASSQLYHNNKTEEVGVNKESDQVSMVGSLPAVNGGGRNAMIGEGVWYKAKY